MIWLLWPWHTDRSLHYKPIHVHYSLAARGGGDTHAVAGDANPESAGVGTQSTQIAEWFLLLNAIHSTASNWGYLYPQNRERIAFVELSPFAKGARHRFLRAS